MPSKRRLVAGACVALVGIAALCGLMLPVRNHLSSAIPALVLVVPVVAGVAIGGFTAGVVAAAIGFLAYDLCFIPPFGTLTVGSAENWLALVVYVAVTLVVARVVASLQQARAEARRREDDARRLYLLSDLLIEDRPLPELLQRMAATIRATLGPRWVAVLLPVDQAPGDLLRITATAGEALTADEQRMVAPVGGRPQAVHGDGSSGDITRVVLTTAGRPVGVLAMAGADLKRHDWEVLRTYANQAALALERSQLRQDLLHKELLEEVDRWRDALVGAVSHDLRTPLATIKTSVSALRQSAAQLSDVDRKELLELIEVQSDSLARLVTDLLDVTRIRAGALEPRPEIGAVGEMVDEALTAVGAPSTVTTCIPVDLPLVRVDPVLMVRVLANLLENAERHNPSGMPIEVSATARGGVVEVAVRDHGPGVPVDQQDRVFEMFNRVSGGGRAGLGLTIAKSFVEAHGESIRVEDATGGGARFVFSMPTAGIPAGVG